MSTKAYLILYVADQERSCRFYAAALGRTPQLHVPGMTEFGLNDGSVLGLMPAQGIKRLLGAALPDPTQGGPAPRAELYLVVDQAQAFHARALAAGATELSPLLPRDWGHDVAYSLDPDGHVLAFAQASATARPAT